jgi:hypothetical protein
MKILKQGKLKNELFVGECNACGCIVEKKLFFTSKVMILWMHA